MSGAATVGGNERLRLFLALELPDEVVDALVDWGKQHLSGGRPVESFHVTLAFLGSRPRSDLETVLGAVRESARESSSFTLHPVRYRETRSVGMLVLEDPSGGAARLAARLNELLYQLGVYQPEPRPWLPHVTVLRFRRPPRLSPPVPEIGPFAPSGAAAFLSRLRRSGAQYEVLESCSLGGTSET